MSTSSTNDITTTCVDSNNRNKLTSVVTTELVKFEDVQSEEIIRNIQNGNLQLKQSNEQINEMNNKIDLLNQNLNESKEEIKVINNNIEKLHNGIQKTYIAITEQQKIQCLGWAIEQVEHIDFYYNQYTYYEYCDILTSRINGKELIRNILYSFREGNGYDISDIKDEIQGNYKNTIIVQSESFRNQLQKTIHRLTGVKPRIVNEQDDKYFIYYC